MGQVAKFLELESGQKRLLLKAAWWYTVLSIALGVVPLKMLLNVLRRMRTWGPLGPGSRPESVERVVWAVTTVGRYGERMGACLAQALTGYLLLAYRGQKIRLRIGFMRGLDGRPHGHAWLECNGQVIIGDLEDLSRYHIVL